ncbi:MAG: MFS transporter [Hyphomonadaceae bacterium]|nr:MFS transporter [Hyphomonadaceae bacterium]
MFKSLGAIAALLLATAFLYAGNGLQGTLLAVRGDIENFSTTTIGLLTSAYFAGFIAGCRMGPGMIKSVGHIRAFVALASIASSSALAHALIVEPITWAVLRATTGFAFAGLAMVLESWINERATNANRGQLLSIYRIVDLGALTIGNALLGFASPDNFVLFAFVSILISIALVPVALTRSSAPAPLASAKLDLAKLYKVSPVGAAGALATGLANAAFWGLAPVFVQRIGYETATVGAFMSVAIIGGAIFQFPLGWMSDRIDRRKVVFGAVLLGIGAAVALALFGGVSQISLFVTGFLFGGLIIPTYGLCAAHANDHAEPGEAVATSGGLLLLHGLGAVAGAFIGAAIMSVAAPALFFYIAVVYGAFLVFTALRMVAREAIAEDEKVAFVPAPRSPSTSVTPDPLLEEDLVEPAP